MVDALGRPQSFSAFTHGAPARPRVAAVHRRLRGALEVLVDDVAQLELHEHVRAGPRTPRRGSAAGERGAGCRTRCWGQRAPS
jgi:hypothetical protein